MLNTKHTTTINIEQMISVCHRCVTSKFTHSIMFQFHHHQSINSGYLTVDLLLWKRNRQVLAVKRD